MKFLSSKIFHVYGIILALHVKYCEIILHVCGSMKSRCSSLSVQSMACISNLFLVCMLLISSIFIQIVAVATIKFTLARV